MSSEEEIASVLQDVIVVGADASGLMAARVLLQHGRFVTVLEARARQGGRAFSYPLQQQGYHEFKDIAHASIPEGTNPNYRVDFGCSSIHSIEDEGNTICCLALHHGMKIPKFYDGVIGNTTNYENTLVCPWYKNGARISQHDVGLAHRIHYAVVSRISSYFKRSKTKPALSNLYEYYNEYKKEILETFSLVLSKDQDEILIKILNRYYGYCAHVGKQSFKDLLELGDGMDDAAHFNAQSILASSVTIDKFLVDSRVHDTVSVGPSSRIRQFASDVTPAEGYGTFVTEVLGARVDVEFRKVVRTISTVTHDGTSILKVECEHGTAYYLRKAVVTVPLGVLQDRNKKRKITFRPELSQSKQKLIRSFAIGYHNKILLQYKTNEI